ncbi:hypothetical protein RM553_16210 [Zunongwangia sp. F363]|uniref:Uncharacterized protein n=1 Tax=Autumnicola tepida TaxID=3075595 RepID=A0ABU3CDR0_9FLAO|nr:hypothetical protein [Zunongwangia sp. F363]MDT0644383.1 hypothetical protein [Zunongwangia sp. F363]
MKTTTTSVMLVNFLMIFLISFSASAQKYQAYNLEQIMKPTTKSRTSFNTAQVENINALIYDLNPTIFVEDQKVKSYDEKDPLIARVKPDSWNLLSQDEEIFNSIELITLQLPQANSFSQTLDLSGFKSFNNLKYIFVECTGNCTAGQVERIFRNVGEVTVLYVVSTPE